MRNSSFGDIAHLGHVELLTSEFDKSRWFFTELLAMREVAAEGDSVFLHAWDDYERYTLKLTASPASGVGRVALRTGSQEALERRAAAIEATGRGIGWKDGEQGVGRSYAFTDPDGHPMEHLLRHRVVTAPDDAKPALKNQADSVPRPRRQRPPPRPRQLPRQGRRGERRRSSPTRSAARPPSRSGWTPARSRRSGSTSTASPTTSSTPTTGPAARRPPAPHRLRHPTPARTSSRPPTSSSRTASTSSRGRTSTRSSRPSSSTSGSPAATASSSPTPAPACMLAPDWPSIEWTEAERAKGQAWGMKTIETFHTHGTPPVG